MLIGIMEGDNVGEGLFLKNYLGTVSAVPRPRTAFHMETRTSYINSGQGVYQKYKNQSMENGLPNHARIIVDNETEIIRKSKQSEFVGVFLDTVQKENDEEKEKKKEKKWTIGGLFRRKTKKDADDSSEESDDENKKGFLSRKKSKRERRKLKGRSTANGFDVVIPQQKITSGIGLTADEQLWSVDLKNLKPDPSAANGLVRYIHRHQNNETHKTTSLQIPKHSRKDLRSSGGGSETLEGRKGRKEVMARAEAKRDMIRDDSSSDECESYHSNSSLNRLDPSQRRPKRSDRLNKRLSREDLLIMHKENDLRLIKSDLEGGRRLASRGISRPHYQDSSDHETVRFNLINHSGTPSPNRSPRASQKHLMQYMALMQNAYPTSTFPPGIHHQQMRNVISPPQRNNNIYAKENYSQPFISYRNPVYKGNRSSEYIRNLPRSISNIDNNNRRTLMNYEQYLSSCGTAKEKSLSYDQNIHRASYFENEPEEQLPKPNSSGVLSSRRTLLTDERDVYNESGSGVAENRTESSPSLPVDSGNVPHQPTQIVQRSTSGNSFCESLKNHIENRSLSYQHIPNNLAHAHRPPIDSIQKRNVYYWSHDEGTKSPVDNIYCNIPQTTHTSPTSPVKPVINSNNSILRYYADQNPRSRNPIHITCNPMTSLLPEQPYLSDSQMILKPQNKSENSASGFWKLKDQEIMQKAQQKKSESSFLKPPATDRSRSNSPRLKEIRGAVPSKLTNGNDLICSENNKKVLKKECDIVKVNRVPPEPPVRRLSKQEVLARLHKCEQLKNQENERLRQETKTQNLDDALNELESIYNSLRLKDEDLMDRAERRDLPAYRPKEYNSVAVRDKVQNFYAEAIHSPKSAEFISGHQKALPLKKSGLSDKKADDMAFRRMNSRDRNDTKKFPSQSYLRTSPAISPVSCTSPTFQKELAEPDVTFDDVVFRNFRHANSTLKIQDPQPPFGIPIGVIAPAPNSDYLHAMPKERFRPTFTSSKTPDVVKDDLAFRNLRKDKKTGNCLIVDPLKSDANGLLKKRAVRSLSANLFNIMQKTSTGFIRTETNNNSLILDKNVEKTQSLTDLTKEKVLEKRLKELKEEKNAKRAEFFELSQQLRRKSNEASLSWTDLANLNENFESLEKKEIIEDIKTQKYRSPVVALSKYPAAAPAASLQGNPFKESSSNGSVDEEALESLLSALANEAKNTSKDLEKQLSQLENKAQETEQKSLKEFNTNFKGNLDKSKRRRNLSLSNANEVKEDERKTGSLERRRRRKTKNEETFDEFLRKVKKANEMKTLSKSDSSSSLSSKERKFEVVTDLAQIIHDVEAERKFNNEKKVEIIPKEDVFQEVYEYNCNLKRESRAEEKEAEERVCVSKVKHEDIETEFEKLHQQVNESTKQTKEPGEEDPLVNDLLAEVKGYNSGRSFPFPEEESSRKMGERMVRHRDGTSPSSSKGEGVGQA